MPRAPLALAMLALLSGCADLGTARPDLKAVAQQTVLASPAALSAAELSADGGYILRLVPVYGSLTAFFVKLRADSRAGTVYSARNVAQSLDEIGLSGAAWRLRAAATYSEWLHPIAALAGCFMLSRGWQSGEQGMVVGGAWLIAGAPTLELLSHELLVDTAISEYQHWLASRGGPMGEATLPSAGGALWRSALIPGWGQWYKGDPVQGVVAMGIVIAGLLAAGDQQVYSPGTPAAAYALGAYGFNLLDALLTPPSLRPYGASLLSLAPRADGVQLALRLEY